ncbi:MAG: hypothetical protein ACRENX_01255 [Candidatus Dormibacteria bacterium]
MAIEAEVAPIVEPGKAGSEPPNEPAVSPPESVDAEWAERIAKALEARRAGQELRKGKPEGFATQWPIQLRNG